MIRAAIACAGLALTALATGCTMCAHPYDECGPMFTGECGQDCSPWARAGSILSPSAYTVTSAEVMAEEAAPADAVPSEGEVLSKNEAVAPGPTPAARPQPPPPTRWSGAPSRPVR